MTLICMHLARKSSFSLIEQSCLPRRHICYLKCVNFFLLLRWLSFVIIFPSQISFVGRRKYQLIRTVCNRICKKFYHQIRNKWLFHLNIIHILNILNIEYAIQDREQLLVNIDHRFDNDNPRMSMEILFLRGSSKKKDKKNSKYFSSYLDNHWK